ncbi:hypothetical protein ACX0HA_10175 [Flavobacterium hauense]
MEELDLLKKDWKKNENKFPKLSEKEIYAMLHKNSTSVVKWIFLISILEFAFFLALTLLINDNATTTTMQISDFTMIAVTALDYMIMVYFFAQFYINYKKITTTDKVKNLMVSILKTRKTVSTYIFVKITYFIVFSIMLFIILFNNEPAMLNTRHLAEEKGEIVKLYLTTIVVILVSVAALATVIWLFYRLIYGLLLKRLNKNYEELKKIDF